MIQRRRGLAPPAGSAARACASATDDRQELDRDRAMQLRVGRAIDDAHAAAAEHAVDPVVADLRADREIDVRRAGARGSRRRRSRPCCDSRSSTDSRSCCRRPRAPRRTRALGRRTLERRSIQRPNLLVTRGVKQQRAPTAVAVRYQNAPRMISKVFPHVSHDTEAPFVPREPGGQALTPGRHFSN